MRTAVFPGTFDPVTNGHVDIAERASKLFDRVVVGVFDQQAGQKRVLFDTRERLQMVQECLAHIENLEVRSYGGLTVDFARSIGATGIIRGLRASLDFEQEFPAQLMNRQMAPDVEVVWLITSPRYMFVSSSLLKEVSSYGGDIGELAPSPVAAALRTKLAAGTIEK